MQDADLGNFEDVIVGAIHRAEPIRSHLIVLGDLIRKVSLRENHDAILHAWNEATAGYGDLPEEFDDLPARILQQKAQAKARAVAEASESAEAAYGVTALAHIGA